MAKQPPRRDQRNPAERVHELAAKPVTTGRPDIGTPELRQVHALRADNLDVGRTAERDARRAVRTSGGGVGIAIAAASGSASGAGGATADSTTITADPTAITSDGAVTEADLLGAMAQGSNGTRLQVNDALSTSESRPATLESESQIFPPDIIVDPPAPASYRARDVMRASTWTGRRSAEEQTTVIRTFAPDAMAAAEQLRTAIHEKRRNDPTDAEAMATLKELHWAIGELIREAERGPISAMAWESYERHREKLTGLARRGASLTAAAPLAVGLAQFLSWLSGVPVGETMIAGVYGTMIGGEALRAKRR